ncbi:MAG TPA: response regulator [Phototrophicaceae bacterium]|nr:response regulator [Phototrophicaceae bacterium]
MQILVIDDDHDLLDNISIMLEIAGYEVLRASNGIDGLRLIHDFHPALIVCDVMMPEVTGYDVLEELQANSNTVSIPMIFLTSQSETQDIRRGMQAGVDDYLTKPFTEQELLTTIQHRLEKRHQWELQQRIAFAHHLVQKQEQESQRIARELHQGFRQKLLNVKFYLDTQVLNPSISSQSLMQTMQFSLEELLAQVTTLSYVLYPMMLPHLGLIATLQWYFNTVQQRLNIKIKFDNYNMEARLTDAAEIVFYRIAQQIMENISTATYDIDVVLWRDENTVSFSISHLPGFEKNRQMSHLQLLEEYGHTINARIAIQADDENGATVCVTLPNAVFQQPEVPTSLPVIQPVSVHDTTLLVASPDAAFLEHVSQLLETIVRVIPCQTNDPAVLLTELNTCAPQILVLDLLVPSNMLPSLSRETAVIMLSPYSDEAFVRQTMRQGIMGFIPRVKARTELLAAVQTVMHGERYISASLVLGTDQVQNPKSLKLDALLTRREREVMELILQDMTHADIASKLVISPRTVEKHRANMMEKLALNTHTELILFALRHGLMSPA